MEKEMFAFLKMKKIRSQLYTIYLIAVFLPVTVLGTFMIFNNSRLWRDYYRDLLESENLRLKTILFEITTQIYNISEEIAFDDTVRKLLTDNYYLESNLRNKISDTTILDNYNYNHAEIEAIEIYTDNPDFIDYKQFHYANDSVKGTEWYQRAARQSSVFWTALTSEDAYGNEYWNLSLIRKIPLIDSDDTGVLVIRLSDNYLKSRISSQKYVSTVSVDGGPVFLSSDRKNYGQDQRGNIDYEESYYQYKGNLKQDNSTCFAEISTLNLYQSDSRIYICTLDGQAYINIREIMAISIIIIAVAILVPGVIIHVFTNYFTSRVLALRHAMHQASNEDYKIENPIRGQDEMSEAFSDLEVMVQKIKQKDAQLYEARLNEKELINEQQGMEYKMLASQINPHFLYNTLETIRMKAFTAGDREVANAIKLLGKSMRYVLDNTGAAFTTLSRELEHVTNYLSIQKLRFGNKFDSEISIGQEVEVDSMYTMPLLLQPVVENAILHGLEEKETGGIVKIELYRQGDDLYIDVSDNGCGMEEEELARVRRNMESREEDTRSIGFYNINQRIRLCYGAAYGVQIDSRPGQGTVVRLILPFERLRQGWRD